MVAEREELGGERGGGLFSAVLPQHPQWLISVPAQRGSEPLEVLRDAKIAGHLVGDDDAIWGSGQPIHGLSGSQPMEERVSQERGAPWVAAFDMGVTYQVSRNLRLDAGINLGLTRSAEDLNPFVGLTWKF